MFSSKKSHLISLRFVKGFYETGFLGFNPSNQNRFGRNVLNLNRFGQNKNDLFRWNAQKPHFRIH